MHGRMGNYPKCADETALTFYEDVPITFGRIYSILRWYGLESNIPDAERLEQLVRGTPRYQDYIRRVFDEPTA